MGIALVMAMATAPPGRSVPAACEWLKVGTVFACLLLAPPVSKTHSFVLLLMPLTALVTVAARATDVTVRWALPSSRIASEALNIAGKPLEYYGPMLWGTLRVWLALVRAARRTALAGAAGLPHPPPFCR
jgi:hypothetical protein